MNRGATSVANRKELQELYRMKDFHRQKSEGKKEVTLDRKAYWLRQDHFSLGDGRGLSGRFSNNAD